jgi:hypothetical protein
MTRRQHTFAIWIGLFAIGGLLLTGAGFGLMRAWHSLDSSEPAVASTTLATVTWSEDAADTGRALEPYTRQQIADDYARAWLTWNLAYRNRDTAGLPTYFSGDAGQAIVASVEAATTGGQRIYQVDTNHDLQLHLYSADGTIVSFTDSGAAISQLVLDRDGNLLLDTSATVAYDVVMKLQDGNWRIDNWERTAAEPVSAPSLAAGGASIVTASGAALVLDGAPFEIHGINYYPRDTPWDKFWANYDPAVVDADFAVIADSLGLNTIRIFIPYAQFGGSSVSDEMLSRLDDLLRRARDHNLKVVVTLFDFFGGQYDPLHWPDADRYLAGIVPRFAENPAILAWDLKNEPDLDPQQDVLVDAWIRYVAGVVRSFDPAHLITVGWANPNSATRASDVVDVVSFHFYKPANDFPNAVRQIQGAMPGTPIVLSEFGLPTWNPRLFPGGHTEKEQAAYYADILQASREAHLAGTMAWTLYDFPDTPESIGGRWPWQAEPEQHLGVLRNDGSAKPAAALLAPDANLNVPRPGRFDRYRKPFWMTWLGLAAVVVVAFSIWRRWKLRGAGRAKKQT